MGRTWLLRGVAVAVLAVLVAAWAFGLAKIGGDPSPAASPPAPPVSESSFSPAVFDIVGSIVVEKEKVRRTRDATSEDALTDPSTDAFDEPTDAPGTPAPTSPDPTSPEPSDEPSDPPPSPPTPSNPPTNPPANPPTNPPAPPAEECTDLLDILDCVLDPITGSP
jgi:hypothetical protein